ETKIQNGSPHDQNKCALNKGANYILPSKLQVNPTGPSGQYINNTSEKPQEERSNLKSGQKTKDLYEVLPKDRSDAVTLQEIQVDNYSTVYTNFESGNKLDQGNLREKTQELFLYQHIDQPTRIVH
ncbi:unnamed protein product, partial [Owenia fusiformis]